MNPTLQDIINAFAESEDAGKALLAKCTAAHLATLKTEAQTAFGVIRKQATFSETDVAAAEQLTGAKVAIDAQLSTLAAADDAAAQKIADMAAQVDDTPAEAEPTGDTPAEGDPAPQADATATATGETPPAEGTDTTGGDPAPAGDQTPEAIAASAAPPVRRTPVDLSKLKSVSPAARQRDSAQLPEGALVAAADVPGVPTGYSFASIREVGEAAVRRLRTIPNQRWTGSRHIEVGLAFIAKEFPEELIASGDKNDLLEKIDYAASESRLQGGSLVAAGGWCAPSETVYDVFEVETRDGMVSVPEMVLTRGGIEFSPGPLFSEIYAAVGFSQTEAQAIANTAKTCFEVPCPDFDEVRLDLLGVCINAGILQNKAYPEFVDRYIRGALTAHAHKMNASKIDRMQAGATDVDYTVIARFLDLGALAAVVEALDMQARDYRTRHRMNINATLEVILPQWLPGVIRSDLINRGGDRDYARITDDEIKAMVSVPGVRIQWVYDYQDTLTGGAAMGAAVPITEWPDEVEFLMYAAGTFVAGVNDIITLNTGIFDFPNLTTNKYNALFTEEGLAMIKRGHDARQVSVPLCPSGVTGLPAAIECAVAS